MTRTPTKYAERYLTSLLAALGLDVEYVRAERNTIFRLADDGSQIPVLDLLGGFGSLILGHNHPGVVARAREFLDASSVVHAQLSVHSAADRVGELLNTIIKRELDTPQDYTITFANSGAEAIEAAAKHAELSRVLRATALLEEIELNYDSALAAVRAGTAALPRESADLPAQLQPPASVEEFESMLGTLAAHNLAQAGKSPIFFALERSFHGKLIGSVQLTHNPLLRSAFQGIGFTARFMPVGESPDYKTEYKKVADTERATVFDAIVVDGGVRIVERDFPIFSAFLLEPIQGEGGVHVLTAELAQYVRQFCDEIGAPVIVDEIQSGMGRSGAFFASSLVGLRGDYYALAKSLGGGLAKVSAMLVREPAYCPQFEILHGSSTFAKDGFATAVALRTLEILEADNGQAYRMAAERGERVMAVLGRLAQDYPDVIKEVRGRGLLIGVELVDQSSAESLVIREKFLLGALGYLAAAYLLRVHGIRLLPTASMPNMLRIEPSIYLSDAEIGQLERGIEALCRILRNQDALHLIEPLTAPAPTRTRSTVQDFRGVARQQPPEPQTGPPSRTVALVLCLRSPATLKELDPSLADLPDAGLERYLDLMAPAVDMLPFPAARIDSPLGTSVDVVVYPLLATVRQLARYLATGQLDGIRAGIDARIRAAKAAGCDVVGLGTAAAAVTADGAALRIPKITLTSGTALTVATATGAIERAARERFGGLAGRTLVAVGGGTVATLCAAMLAGRVDRVVLVGDGAPQRLRAAACRVYQEVWAQIADGGELSGLPGLLAEDPLVARWLREGRRADAASGEQLAAHIEDTYRHDPFVAVTDDLAAVRDGHVVLVSALFDATGPQPFLPAELVGEAAVLCDVSAPPDAVSGLWLRRPDLHLAQAATLATPGGASLPAGARGALAEGQLYTGMAEAVVLGLAGPACTAALPATDRHRIRRVAELAAEHGFRPVPAGGGSAQ